VTLLLRPWPFPVLLALRYLKSTRRDAFATFLSIVAVLGITLGVAAMIVVMAALSGLHEHLLGQMLATTPQLEVTLPEGVDGGEVVAAVAAVPGVEGVQRVARGQGWLLLNGTPHPLRLVGYEGELPATFPGASGRERGLYVPEAMAAQWALQPGQRVSVVSPRPRLTPLGPQPRIRTVAVAGTFESYAVDPVTRAALPLDIAEGLLAGGGRFLEVRAASHTAALRIAPGVVDAVTAECPGCAVRSWREINRSLYFVLRLEKTMLFVAVGLIVVVAALALVVDLALMIASKRGEIGLLGTLGATPGTILRAFLTLGGLLAVAGITVGTALGVTTAWVLDHFQLLSVPGEVLFVSFVPFRVTVPDVALILGVSVTLVFLSSLYAARRAAALKPIDALYR
jgi:lipoprotein-releasing system permease protein